MVYRSKNQEASEYLTRLFESLSESSDRQLRNTSADLYAPFLKTTCGLNCFSYREAKLWNDLKKESKMVNTFTKFKSSLKNPDPENCLTFTFSTYKLYIIFYYDLVIFLFFILTRQFVN